MPLLAASGHLSLCRSRRSSSFITQLHAGAVWFGRQAAWPGGGLAQTAFEARVEAVAGNRLDTYVMGEQLKRFDGEVLVLHAPDDAEVAFGDAQAMAGTGNHVRLVPMPGLGHRRIISHERVFAELSAFGGADMIAAGAA